MKQLILACLLIVCVNTFAASKSTAPRYTIHSQDKPWQISEMSFIELYGKDDTSRALIDYYFHKRRGGKLTMLITGGIIPASIITAILINKAAIGTSSYISGGTLLFIIIAEAALIAMVVGFFEWLSHSRHKLFTLLKDYQNGKSITSGMRSNNIFRRYLAMEQHLPTK